MRPRAVRGPDRGQTIRGPDRGQTSPIGTVLLLAIVVVGAGATVAVGATTLQAGSDEARMERVEHAVVRFDAEAMPVGLRQATARSVDLPASGEASYDVDADAGWMRMSHVNHSGDGDTNVLTNTSLGAVVYEGGDTTIAYQGGGVWRGTGNGSRLVSPPEFRYGGSTLTVPIVSVEGSGEVVGQASAAISVQDSPTWLVPNRSAPDGGNASYQNPIEAGTITITVHSDHYVAWAAYFAQRTAGNASIDHGNRTATMTIIAGETDGDADDRIVLYVTRTEIDVNLD